jgi:serine/threonine protein kinase
MSQSIVANHLVGSIVGEYSIERQLGQSSINSVYGARSPKQNQPVMFTTFTLPEKFAFQAQERFKERFMHVVSALIHLRHQHILPIYDLGAQPGYLYMVTPLTTANILATSLQHQSRFTTTQILEIMKQIAVGVDYAHSSGFVHGSLKSGNILLDSEQGVLIAGFGLVQILTLSGVEQIQHPYAHLLSVALTFLGDAFTIAPEVVQGMPIAPGADIYALGIILFELLSGKPPFAEADPLKTALARLQKPVPSILEMRPDLPPSLDFVLQGALERNPASRYQSARDMVVALEQALRAGNTAKQAAVTAKQSAVMSTEYTAYPDERTWEGLSATSADNNASARQQQSLSMYNQPTTSAPPTFSQSASQQEMPNANSTTADEASVDPFVWWSTASLTDVDRQTFSPVTREPAYQQPTLARPSYPHPSVDKKRRRMVTALAAGGVIVLAGLGAGGVGLAHMLQGSKKVQNSIAQPSSTPTSQPVVASNPTKAAKPSPTATQKPAPTATQQPSPTPKPSPTPSHTGTVVGSTSQGVNSSTTFANPQDGNSSLLINLPGGNFVAFESACTHEGVRCYYDPGSHLIICPRHNAHFDPANGAAVRQGPPPRPLPAVPIKINGDGTITVG